MGVLAGPLSPCEEVTRSIPPPSRFRPAHTTEVSELGPGLTPGRPARMAEVMAIVWSAIIFAAGCGAVYLALSDAYPAVFSLGIAACAFVVAAWGILTLRTRDSDLPEGKWLWALSILGVASGAAGLASGLLGAGAVVFLCGFAGLRQARSERMKR